MAHYGNSDNTCSPLVRPQTLKSTSQFNTYTRKYCLSKVTNVTRLKIMWRCGALLSRVTQCPGPKFKRNVTRVYFWLRIWYYYNLKWYHGKSLIQMYIVETVLNSFRPNGGFQVNTIEILITLFQKLSLVRKECTIIRSLHFLISDYFVDVH